MMTIYFVEITCNKDAIKDRYFSSRELAEKYVEEFCKRKWGMVDDKIKRITTRIKQIEVCTEIPENYFYETSLYTISAIIKGNEIEIDRNQIISVTFKPYERQRIGELKIIWNKNKEVLNAELVVEAECPNESEKSAKIMIKKFLKSKAYKEMIKYNSSKLTGNFDEVLENHYDLEGTTIIKTK